MLAVGHSVTIAVLGLQQTRPPSIRFVCLVAAPEGIQYFHKQHPEVPIYTAAVNTG
ncbi:MAG: uracil phosphoribosyltransferase [Thermostichus sp. DG_1_5_bins_95]